ncbi:alpha/beta-hydrolase [Fomitiporia mediterranea MF3/22]|uniref:alpha/beta-hydrolase n=1 Tax=Fomitiporia mediterranea (strain MF3/22) TaxID=694068 RepID=UPI0004409A98|nr:alpha/beta-hydrolase [Fomitiporia mediterranea MF3/22]EJD08022.1 alpha/beta-hydrolase [Fomitiporia mediterranea MF3/22]
MARFPVLGRLYYREYVAVIFGFILITFETLLRSIIFFLPSPVIRWFHDQTRRLFKAIVHVGSKPPVVSGEEAHRAHLIRVAVEFGDLCSVYGYDWEEHIVQTKDGYLLSIHRIPRARSERTDCEARRRKPVVYLHHGLLMCSEIFMCLTSAERSLPLVLAEAGYDVWLGNNRGNKYSRKHTSLNPHSQAFWNFGIDEYAMHDIPDSIAYILEATGEKSLSYVGFSQGTAQAFAALSINPSLNKKVDVFVALAPAMSPPGLSAPLVDGLMKASPALMYLFFGRRSILHSTTTWQSILYPPIFTSIISRSLTFLFAWTSDQITPIQKIAAYAHLYSGTSTKAVVHWFQIMRNAEFTMYDDDVKSGLSPLRAGERGKARFYYRPARFPTKNIKTPTVLLYGTSDSLVDIDVMRRQLPEHAVSIPLDGYEHLDILWGKNVHEDVIPEVMVALRSNARIPEPPMKVRSQSQKMWDNENGDGLVVDNGEVSDT